MKIKLEEYIEQLDVMEDREELANRDYQRQLFQSYVLREGNFSKLRKKLWQNYQEGKPLEGEKGLRKQLAAFDLSYFGRAYLPHYFVKPSPKFHEELDDIWHEGVLKERNPYDGAKEISRLDGCRYAIQAPRGHAKTTNLTFKGSAHAALYGYKHYILLLSDSSDQADGFLMDIKTEMEENMLIREDFGNLQGRIWKNNVILLRNGIKIESIGSGKKIRGRRHGQWRPDLIVCDDLENDEHVNTLEQRKKLENWYYKAVSKAGDSYTDIVYIGTLLHYDSLLAKVSANPDYNGIKYRGVISFAVNAYLWTAWEAIFTNLSNPHRKEEALAYYQLNKSEMLEGTEVLWEEKLSYYKLMVMKIAEGDASFNSEIQNDPIDPASCTFREEWFDFYDDAPPDFSHKRFVFFAANDPSLGKNKRSDTSAIIVIAKDTKTGYLYTLIASVERRSPDVIIDDIMDTSKRMKLDYNKGFHRIGIETVQFQYFFKDVLAKRSAEMGEYLPIEEIHSIQNKDVRIKSLQPLVKNGYLKFSRKHKTLLQQMMEYPMGRNDDAPDALQMCVKLAIDDKGSRQVDYRSVLSRALRFKNGTY